MYQLLLEMTLRYQDSGYVLPGKKHCTLSFDELGIKSLTYKCDFWDSISEATMHECFFSLKKLII